MYLRCKDTDFLLYEHRNGTNFILIYKKLTFGARMEYFRHGLTRMDTEFFCPQIITD